MNIAETISVNPVSKTLGVLNPEATLEFIRSHSSANEAKKSKTEKKSVRNFLLASSTPGVKDFGSSMLLFRWLFSAILIVSGSFILAGEITSPFAFVDSQLFAISEIVVGGMLTLGLFSRIVMIASCLFFGYASFLSIEAGIFDMQNLLFCLGSLVFAIMGSGRYSCDFLIRKSIILHRRRKQRQLREDRLSYRAYRIHHME